MQQLFAIYNATEKLWWGQGHLTPERQKAYLWKKEKLAKEKLKSMDEFYGFSEQGQEIWIVVFKVQEMGRYREL
jgi:hypothetical protein